MLVDAATKRADARVQAVATENIEELLGLEAVFDPAINFGPVGLR
jgi:hypothetical protein